MFRKSLYILMLMCICFSMCACGNNKEMPPTEVEIFVEAPYVQVHAVYDSNGNLLQQTLYNETNNEYYLKEFSYALSDSGKWVCTDQVTTIIKDPNDTDNYKQDDIYITLYKLADLQKGPIVLLDNAEAKVSIIKYLAKDNWWEFGYELKIENKTDKVIVVSFDDITIMDIYCKPVFYLDYLEARSTRYFTMAWDYDTITRSHLPYIDNIKFMIRVYDDDSRNALPLSGNTVLIKH